MATWGTQSVANRMLAFAYKRFDGKVPEPGTLDDDDRSHLALTYDHSQAVGTHSLRSVHAWAKSELPAGQVLRALAPLFKKLDENVVEEETARLAGKKNKPGFRIWEPGLGPGSLDPQRCSFGQVHIMLTGICVSMYPKSSCWSGGGTDDQPARAQKASQSWMRV